MVIRAISARSRELMRCSGSGQPVELRKLAELSPSSWARYSMSLAKLGSVPERPSANTMLASLPELLGT